MNRTLVLVQLGVIASCVEQPERIERAASPAITALAQHDMATLSRLAHPTKGIRFSPYAHVNVATDRTIRATDLETQWASTTPQLWGTHDGSGDPIRLTFADYWKKFVYDYDFARAPKVAYNAAPMGRGNTINNIAASYPGASIVEYHVPGIDPKYNGMDWRSLWLVFEQVSGAWHLVGVVHGAWTI